MTTSAHTPFAATPIAGSAAAAIEPAAQAVQNLGASHLVPLTSLLAMDMLPRTQMTATVSTAFIQGTVTFTAVLRRQSELKRIEQEAAAVGAQDAPGGYTGGVLRGVVASIDKIDLNVKVDAFHTTEEGIAALLEWPGVGAAMQKRYYAALFEEKQKN